MSCIKFTIQPNLKHKTFVFLNLQTLVKLRIWKGQPWIHLKYFACKLLFSHNLKPVKKLYWGKVWSSPIYISPASSINQSYACQIKFNLFNFYSSSSIQHEIQIFTLKNWSFYITLFSIMSKINIGSIMQVWNNINYFLFGMKNTRKKIEKI